MTFTPSWLVEQQRESNRIIKAKLWAIPLRRLRRIHRAAERGNVPFTDGTKCLGFRCLPWYKRALWIAAPLDHEVEGAYWYLGATCSDHERQKRLVALTASVLLEREVA